MLCAGIRLLQAMGWRQGKGVGPGRAAPASMGAGRWGPEAGIGAENTPIYALPPKSDTHGLGFDPFKVLCTLHATVALQPGTPGWSALMLVTAPQSDLGNHNCMHLSWMLAMACGAV